MAWQDPPVVIIGAGPVGQRVATELLQRTADTPLCVYLFGDEPREPYDRVRLSSFLARDIATLPVNTGLDGNPRLVRHLGIPVRSIDRQRRVVIDFQGEACPYSRLVLATGSRAALPPVAGIDLPQVYRFRDFADAERLMARKVRSRNTVVIGGGLLGLEAARAMRCFHTRVTIIEQSAHLMFRQLDAEGAALLGEHIRRLGIEVIAGARVQRILGTERLEGILLADERRIACDTVVVAAGITPNIDLARDCGLNVRRGVLVDDQLMSSDPHIYAAGECAEHRATLYGLVAPGFEQAAVVAHALAGGTASYSGSINATRLKVVGCEVFSAGAIETEWLRGELVYTERENGILRKLFLNGNRLDAAMAVGSWVETSRVQEAVRKRRRIWPWQAARFHRSGLLWPHEEDSSVADWPAAATVCNCTGVTRGVLSRALQQGCRDVASLSNSTGASTVCGSCRPLLQQLVGAPALEPLRSARILSGAALAGALLTLLFLFSPAIPYNHSVQDAWQWDGLWRNGLAKQISGFTLLGLTLMLAFVSLPKRIRKFPWGEFAHWRTLHVILGVLAALVLAAHTGLRLGCDLNLLLMLSFTGALLAGAVLSGVAGLQHVLPAGTARRARRLSIWSHILLLWPLPGLLGFHVLKTYWF